MQKAHNIVEKCSRINSAGNTRQKGEIALPTKTSRKSGFLDVLAQCAEIVQKGQEK